jgi:hypothetical protein
MFRKGPLLILLFVCFLQVTAQQADTDSLHRIREYMATQAALRYPVLRMATVSLEMAGNMHYNSRLYGKEYLSGTIRPKSITRAIFTLPVYTSSRQEVSLTTAYARQETVLKNTTNQAPQSTVGDGDYTLQNLMLSLNYKRTDSLFHRRIIWGGALLTGFSLQTSYVRATGLLYGIFPLKTTRTTRISVGLVITADPSAITPVIPTFSYWHRLAPSSWEMSIDLPQRAVLRRPVFSKGLFSIGTEIAENKLLRKVDMPDLQGGFAFKDISLKNGFTLEYPVFPKVLVGCSAGYLITTTYRVQDPGKSNSDYAIGIRRNPGPYIGLSISLVR